ncbi:hypothetical protein ACGS9J_11960 [Serratia quinivorans]|uniref:hypothetical protein n=1 Tax=Serratia quinivorans TaxID=137545 RepID=UPI003F9D285F
MDVEKRLNPLNPDPTARVWRIPPAILWPAKLRAAVKHFFHFGVQDAGEERTMTAITAPSACAGDCLCRSEYGPSAGRVFLSLHRPFRRLSSSFPAASLNDVKRLPAEDNEGKRYDD